MTGELMVSSRERLAFAASAVLVLVAFLFYMAFWFHISF
jgi:hypothetical protein